MSRTVTSGHVLFDHPSHADRPKQPPPVPHYCVYPTVAGVSEFRAEKMDGKRHLNSFQQLEKLGEGTYATVRCNPPRAPARKPSGEISEFRDSLTVSVFVPTGLQGS